MKRTVSALLLISGLALMVLMPGEDTAIEELTWQMAYTKIPAFALLWLAYRWSGKKGKEA